MTSRRFAIIAAGLCGTAMLVGCVIAGAFDLSNTKNTHSSSIDEQAYQGGIGLRTDDCNCRGLVAGVFAARSATLAEIAAVSTPDFVHSDAKEAVNSAETLEESLPNPSQALAPETRPVQIATVSVDDVVHGDFNGVVSDKSLPDTSHALALETPADRKEAVTSAETLDECLAREVCVDQYLWSVYQRAPKQDTVKMVERRKVNN